MEEVMGDEVIKLILKPANVIKSSNDQQTNHQ